MDIGRALEERIAIHSPFMEEVYAMTATNAQVRLMMRERRQGRTQEQAAAKANVQNRKTVSKYERLGQLPSELKQPRTYRTRVNPFAEDWPDLEAMLQQAPELEAQVLFDWLCEHHPGKYVEGQLRTLQRHVSAGRALHGHKLLTLEQVHRPGEVLQTDGTSMNALGITLRGQPFPHLLIHSVLTYSNWEWGRVAQSESLVAIRLGLQSALVRLGHVPAIHQTDNTTPPIIWARRRAPPARPRGATTPSICSCWRIWGCSRARFISTVPMRTGTSKQPTAL